MTQPTPSLLDPAIQQCPYAFYADLRRTSPVRFMPELGAYFVAAYDLGRKILIDSRRYSKQSIENDGRRFIEPNKKAQELLLAKDIGLPISLMAQKEGAEHSAYRSIVDSHFQSGTVRKMEAAISLIASKLLDTIVLSDQVEAVAAFAIPMPLYVISDLLGIPRSEYLTFKRWSDGLVTYVAMVVSDEQALAGAEAMIEMHRYMIAEVAERRRAPREDLLNVLAYARYDGRPLTDHEICGFTDELLVAGNETTTSMIAAGLRELAEDTELQSRLRADPAQIPGFVEDLLRTSTPLQVALRYALTDVTVGDVAIPAGAKIFVGLSSANHDDKAFPDATRIDPVRTGKNHVAFGAGMHHCLGAELARLELRVAFALWLKRFASIQLGQSPDSIAYPESYAIRGPLSLQLCLSANH